MYWLLNVVAVTLIMLLLSEASADESEDMDSDDLCIMCTCNVGMTQVDCSGRRLSELPVQLTEKITHLNMANNKFISMPNLQHLYLLKSLDFSGNQLTSLAAHALHNLTELETLKLARNSFGSWADLNPNAVLLRAEKLLELDLSNNNLQRFANMTDSELLVSHTLETLILEQCGITGIQGQSPISRLSNIKSLRMRGNPMRKLKELSSPTLQHLDVSHCALYYIPPEELSYLPSLRKLQLTHNYRLLISTPFGILSSDSLKDLDVSYCNLDKVVLSGFPDLRRVNMSTNSIGRISANDFYNSTKLEVLDLSYNSIAYLHKLSLKGLISLKNLNLTGNKIQEIEEDLFLRTTVTLLSLSLSRNYFTSVKHLQSVTLQTLDLSMCEIDTIDKDCLKGMWSLKTLNLSRNLIGSIPNSLSSDTLTTLDLSNNRLSAVNNYTFHMLPRLSTLSVAGNRFSAVWSKTFFESNRYLERVDMSDNTWRCECADADMFEFFSFVTLEPSKLEEASALVCSSPANLSGVTWQDGCEFTWYPSKRAAKNDAMILFLTVMAIFVACCTFVVVAVRRFAAVRSEAARRERERQAEEARERLRRLRMQHEQQALCNAPDPRDLISPPSYAEALMMPRPLSLHSLNYGETKRKKARRRAKSSGDVTSERDCDEEARSRNRKRRSRRFGSHELKEMDGSPRSLRRRLSVDQLANITDLSVHTENDSDTEAAELMSNINTNHIHVVNVSESDF